MGIVLFRVFWRLRAKRRRRSRQRPSSEKRANERKRVCNGARSEGERRRRRERKVMVEGSSRLSSLQPVQGRPVNQSDRGDSGAVLIKHNRQERARRRGHVLVTTNAR